VDTWMAATRDGDVETVMSLMSDDAVFLAAGQPVMRKADFEAAAKAQADGDAPQFDGRSEIHEVKVLGAGPSCGPHSPVDVTPPGGTTVLRKENGKWLLVRDANTLPPMSGEDD
ncbi:MAG: DUF4440 domain-containing protein, partial [Mycobacterium sp.]